MKISSDLFSGKIFNYANLFLIMVTSLVIWNSLLSINLYQSNELAKKQLRQVTFRVLESEPDIFNRLSYNVWADNGIYLIYSPKILNIGKEYTAVVKLSEYNPEKGSDIYKLSLGVLGQFEVTELKEYVSSCDPLCNTLIWNNNLRRSIQNTYFANYCTDSKWVISFLLPNGNCRDINALSVGLVLGGSSQFSAELKNDFRKLGLTHLIAVSGFQVVLMVSFIEYILLRLNLSRLLRLILSIVGIGFLIILVGPQPPVLRSGLSMSISLLVLFGLGRKVSSLRCLVYSLLLLLIVNPFYLYSLSFQLSGLATLGVISAPKIRLADNQKMLAEFVDGFILICSTFLFTLPIIVNLNGYISPTSILANLIILPFTTLITLLNILGLIPWVGSLFLFINSALQSLILFAIKDLAGFAPIIKLSTFSNLEIVLYYTVLILAVNFYQHLMPLTKVESTK